MSRAERRHPSRVRTPYLHLERLEDRTLMDNGFSNLPLNPAQRQALMDGLLGVGNWSNALAGFRQLDQAISLIEQPIGRTLNPSHALLQGLHSPVVNYLTGNPSPTTDGLGFPVR